MADESVTPDWQTDDGSVRLYRADCLEILPTLPGVDAIVSDPPYGIQYRSSIKGAIDYGTIPGDDEPFDPTALLCFENVILWGGNNFASKLPIGGWICWDKRITEAADRMIGSPFELAWCSRGNLFRMIRLQHGGAKNADARNGDVANGARYHPTQKPVLLMERCIECFPGARTIADPFMGSGTTGVACIKTGRKFIGIEIDDGYFQIAVKRIKRALAEQKEMLFPVVERQELLPMAV